MPAESTRRQDRGNKIKAIASKLFPQIQSFPPDSNCQPYGRPGLYQRGKAYLPTLTLPVHRQVPAPEIRIRTLVEPRPFMWKQRAASLLGHDPPHSLQTACLCVQADPFQRGRTAAPILDAPRPVGSAMALAARHRGLVGRGGSM